MKEFLATLFILSVVGTAKSEQQFALMGAGMTSCAEFARAYQKDPVGAGSFFFSWAQGYMSGINRGPLLNKQPIYNLAARSPIQQQISIAQYCDERPLASYVQAVLHLLSTLPKVLPQSN